MKTVPEAKNKAQARQETQRITTYQIDKKLAQ
jgi:hypothetical protein